ncbi:MAG: adenylate cyclase [Microbacterium sp. 69-7]|uniref:CYTH domain protein n=1 Tax=Microbacterium laevaniformans TaxID=36807 RepID=A0A150HHC9_9MICO|nr:MULTISPECIES: CYTH domain-containing protein [Microbacterium]EXJ52215.1 adenylate cyclase [Microbacterium sp. MRS-1]KXZ61563.1 CYTH domain protein [Microbacterium laevaniformans]OJU45773.1 MAG: adenylate cyclase [Microbacterium sp. 69-7]
MTPQPQRALEIELTFDVHGDTPLPDLSGLPGVAVVDGPARRDLDARYLDVPGFALGRAGYAVRRRTGGPDEGWHIKGPKTADGGRLETHWPLDEAPASAPAGEVTVPDAVADAVAEIAAGDLAPIARIVNDRHAYALRDEVGALVAEFVDDHVVATDEVRGVQTTWREWEFELGPAAPADGARTALFDAVTAAVAAVGGRPAASDSKLARTLGL